MSEFGVLDIVFSSSATVYGIPQYLPLSETHPAGACTNPYGKTKYFIEQIISDVCDADEVMAYESPWFNVGYLCWRTLLKYMTQSRTEAV